jgi:predicted kinase
MKHILNFSEFINEQEIIHLNEGIYDPSIFKAIFMAGAPGAGKTYVSNILGLGTGKRNAFGLKQLDSDIAFEKLLKDADLEMTPETVMSKTGIELRQYAKQISKKQQSNYIDGRLGMLIGGTGWSFEKLKKKADVLREIGYETYLIFVSVSLDVALERNAKRDRTLPEDVVRKKWAQANENMTKFQNYFGKNNIVIVDTTESLTPETATPAFKKVKKIVEAPVTNPIALSWIEAQKKLRGIK